MREFLEKLSKGEATIDEVLAAIDDSKKETVPRSRLNDKIDEIKELKEELKARDQQITDLSGKVKGNEELENTVKTLQTQNSDWEKKFKETQIDTALKLAATGAKARDVELVLFDLKRVGGLDIQDDGTIKGLDDALKKLQESKPFLFEQEEGLRGRSPNPNSQGGHNNVKNPWKKESLNLTEQAKIFKEDPELARNLMKQAGINPQF